MEKANIEKLIEKSFCYGKIADNNTLVEWLGEDIGDADTVMYDFGAEGVSYTIGKGEQCCNNSTSCGFDKWNDCDSDFIDYLINL